jgi:hypothetical protein
VDAIFAAEANFLPKSVDGPSLRLLFLNTSLMTTTLPDNNCEGGAYARSTGL